MGLTGNTKQSKAPMEPCVYREIDIDPLGTAGASCYQAHMLRCFRQNKPRYGRSAQFS